MKVKETLCRARELLDANCVEDAYFEGELLFREALGLNRAQLFSDLESEISPEREASFQRIIQRRINGEPSAYIIGRREFFGLDFIVNSYVLIPRPESELLVEKTLALTVDFKTPTIADIGTGCGAIAISLAVNLPQASIYATDISPAALEVAMANCYKHGVADRISLFYGDILEPLPEPADIIVANLPYIRSSDIAAGCPEPVLALDGGADGLDKIERLIHQLERRLNPLGYLLLEIGVGQSDAITGLLNHLFPATTVEVIPDLAGIDRVVSMTLPN